MVVEEVLLLVVRQGHERRRPISDARTNVKEGGILGQQEVIEYLRMLRQTGDDEYHSIRAIAKAIGTSYHVVHRSIYPLARKNILESKATGDMFDWYRAFRLADKWIDEKAVSIKEI